MSEKNGKEIEKYRKTIKYLKGKCKNLAEINSFLQNKLSSLSNDNSVQPPEKSKSDRTPEKSSNIMISPLKNFKLYKECFFLILQKGKQLFTEDFSLEMLFRMLDSSSSGNIPSEKFIEFLKNSLEMTETQIVRLLLILDESCSGNINQKSFFKALDSFSCRSELEHIGENQRFSIDFLLTPLFEKLFSLKMTPLQLFQQAKRANEADYLLYEDWESIWKGDLIGLNELDLKELNFFVAALDPLYKGYFQKHYFVEILNKFLRRLLSSSVATKRYIDMCTKELVLLNEEKLKQNIPLFQEEEELRGDQTLPPNNFNVFSTNQRENNEKFGRNHYKHEKSPKKNEEKDDPDAIFEQEDVVQGDQAVFQMENSSKTVENSQKFKEKLDKKDSKEDDNACSGVEILVSAAQRSGKHLYLCLEAILQDSLSPSQGFTVNEIFSKLDYYYGAYLNKKAKIEILKSIDLNHNGVYDFQEVKEFFLEACQGKVSVKTLLLVFAKELQARQMKTDEIFKVNGMDLHTRLNLNTFIEEIKPILNLDFQQISAIFLEICDENGEISLNNFIEIVDSLRNDKENFGYHKETAKDMQNKKNNNAWALQVQKNNKVRMVLLRFSLALKEKKLSPEEIMRRIDPLNQEKCLNLLKLGEFLRKVLTSFQKSEIQEFLQILDKKNTGMIPFVDFERILCFENEKLAIFPLTPEEKQQIKELLFSFFEEKAINMQQFFDLMDTEKTGVLELSTIKEGLLAQGFDYVDASRFLSIFDINKDGAVEKHEFLEVLAFNENPKKSLIKLSNLPMPATTSSGVSKEIQPKNPNFQKNCLKKLQNLLYTREFKIFFEKNYGKFEELPKFSISRQEFSDFLRSIPKTSGFNKENVALNSEEIEFLSQKADPDRKNLIKFQEFFDFVKTLSFEDEKKGEEIEKINKFIEEERQKDPFLETERKKVMFFEELDKKNKKENIKETPEKIEKIAKNKENSTAKKPQNKENQEEKLQKLEEMVKKSMNVSSASIENKENKESFIENFSVKSENSIKKHVNEDIFKEAQEKFVQFCAERVPLILESLKETSKDFSKLKASKSHLFNNEGKFFMTIFLNPLICLKRCISDILALKPGEKFKDTEFGPNNSDPSGVNALFKSAFAKPENFPDMSQILWKRSNEIVGFPLFNQDSFESLILQGNLGDSWFLGALFLLADEKEMIIGPESQALHGAIDYLLQGVYPKIFHFLRFFGLYVFRFFKEGQPVYVVIDDLLPCLEIEKGVFTPIFAGSENKHEFWVSLIEKAYAKLHYSYQSLESGNIATAVKDLTNYTIRNLGVKFAKDHDFFEIIKAFLEKKVLISCSKWGNAPANPEKRPQLQELKENIPYKILNVLEIKDSECKNSHKSHRLLLLRSPFSLKQIKLEGPWGPDSLKFKRFEEKIAKQFGNQLDCNTFVIRFKDLRGFFDEIQAFVKPKKENLMFSCVDEWGKNNSGGAPNLNEAKSLKLWLKNPKYFFEINCKNQGKAKILIEISQKDPRLLKNARFPFADEMKYLFFMILKHENMKKRKLETLDKTKIVYSSNLVKTREISEEIVLENGGYVLVVNSDKPGVLGKYFVRLFVECLKEEIKFFDEKIKEGIYDDFNFTNVEKEIITKMSDEASN